ncbi:Aldolase-type TIM barrel [Cordyceps fumosorosea ARSEF 2679]|uniref:L-lactate dehydrogenase (cytochrome) n=1 Tax=Cordyceps fumosorosea (strain ARSEF 2679) TaxID=1081104 RepID=A0A168AP21_CORFA|nr:Aldolase-type TIM barrel [Cordyceps fumosorosea ARSEF 2679]OAA69001.1 Aldolase-type TIM barrel [Cordyceps fumosorosea ARSEF 2679]
MSLKGGDVAQHNSADSCWVIVHGKAYDVTDFLPGSPYPPASNAEEQASNHGLCTEHPGGSKIILKYAGKDATEEFEPIHPPDTLDKYLDPSKHLGPVDMSTVEKAADKADDPEEVERKERESLKPLLSQCYNLLDFEAVARRVMKKTAWGYYSSAADDEITLRENHSAFHRIWFRPRVLVDVEHVDLSTTMLGAKTSVPFYVTATALGKLGHPEGEVVLTRASKTHDVIQMIPTLASCSFDEIVDARRGDQVQWLQLYVNKDRAVTKKIVQHAEARGCRGLFVTVDAPLLGRREKDMRSKFEEQGSNVQAGTATDTSQGAARAISSFIDPSLSWADIPWLQGITRMPVVLKGVQRVEDVLRAARLGVAGVVLSNHGGRQLDFAPSGVEVLAETMPALRREGLLDRGFEVYVDGGVRRAGDILKCLCLGAAGVGIGRPFLYAMGAYGQEGVERAMALLKDELAMNMRLLGAASVADLDPSMVDARSLAVHTATPLDNLSRSVYDPLISPPQRPKSKI